MKPAASSVAPVSHAPLPAAKAVPPSVSAAVVSADARKCDAALAQLEARVADVEHGDEAVIHGLLRDAIGRLAGSSRRDVLAALDAVDRELGQHYDFVGLVLRHVHTDQFDDAKATLKRVADKMGTLLAPASTARIDYRQALSDVHDEILSRLRDYLDDLEPLSSVGVPLAQALAAIAGLPDSEAEEHLLHLGATDLEQARKWLNSLRRPDSEDVVIRDIAFAANDRRRSVIDQIDTATAQRQKDLQSGSPMQHLAELLTQNSAIAHATLDSLGFGAITSLPMSGEPPAGLTPEGRKFFLAGVDANHAVMDNIKGAGMFVGVGLLARLPGGAGVLGSLAGGSLQLYQAYAAAEAARVMAGAGLLTREAAEQLDDEVVWATGLLLMNCVASAIGVALSKAELKAVVDGARSLAQATQRMLVTHLSVDAVSGGAGGAFSPKARHALAQQDYSGFAWTLAENAGEAVMMGAASRALGPLVANGWARVQARLAARQSAASAATVPTSIRVTPTKRPKSMRELLDVPVDPNLAHRLKPPKGKKK